MLDETSLEVIRPNFDQTLADLVDACLNDAGGVIDPAVLRRLRERVQAHMTPDVFFELFMAFAAHQEQVGDSSLYQATLQTMQGALKDQRSGRRSIETGACGQPWVPTALAAASHELNCVRRCRPMLTNTLVMMRPLRR